MSSMLIDRRLVQRFDWSLFILTFGIPCVGLVVLYSAGYDPDARDTIFGWLNLGIQSPSFAKQIVYIGAGFVIMLLGLSISPQLLFRYSYILYSFALVCLVAVLAVGTVSHGSRRWFSLGFFNFQPAELMKLALILTLSRYLSRNPPKPGGYGFTDLIVPFLLFGLPMILIVRQPDLGTALATGGVGFLMVLFMGIRPKALIIMVLSVLIAVVPAWHVLHDYQKRRIIVLIDPDADPLGSGYHITQSKIAVGSGQLFGKGFMQGTQTQLEFLPEHTTDFIFSVLAEEWGFVGCAVVMALYFLLLYRMMRIVMRSKDLFAALLVFGVASLIFEHTLVNIGMVVGILPVVGIPLPLFSYGGSSMMSMMLAIGIVMGASIRRMAFVMK